MNNYRKRIKLAVDEINAAIVNEETNAARSAHDIMSRFKTANLVERVESDLLGRTDFCLREYVNTVIGQKLGRFIASTIDFATKSVPTITTDYLRLGPAGGIVEFRAEVYVLTREQFKTALDDAYRAER